MRLNFVGRADDGVAVLELSTIVQSFRRAVVSDGRSFSKDLINQALNVLNRVSQDASLVLRFDQVAKALQVWS